MCGREVGVRMGGVIVVVVIVCVLWTTLGSIVIPIVTVSPCVWTHVTLTSRDHHLGTLRPVRVGIVMWVVWVVRYVGVLGVGCIQLLRVERMVSGTRLSVWVVVWVAVWMVVWVAACRGVGARWVKCWGVVVCAIKPIVKPISPA